MATAALKARGKLGNKQMNILDINIGVYAANGVLVTPAMLGLTVAEFVLPSPAAGYIFEYDHTNNKLKAFTPTSIAIAGTAGTAGADNTIIKVSDAAIGVSGSGTAATLKYVAGEVANETDLSGVTVRVIAIGI